MKRVALIGLLVLAPSAGAAPVQTMVVGRSRMLFSARTVSAAGTRVSAGGKRCSVPAASGLAVLAAARRAGGPPFSVRQEGGCQGLYVFKVGSDRARGRSGWVYKVGRATPGTGAGERTRSIGSGAHVVWFWCRMGSSGSCQRTLEISAGRVAKAGRAQRVVVRGYDDGGRGRPVSGAVVRLGSESARTGAGGVAIVRAPRRGSYRLTATRAGMVPAFPLGVIVR
jgi:hypothetical protein